MFLPHLSQSCIVARVNAFFSSSFFKILEVNTALKEIEKLYSGDKQISFYSLEETLIEECDLSPSRQREVSQTVTACKTNLEQF